MAEQESAAAQAVEGEARFTFAAADLVAAQRLWWTGAVRWQALGRFLLILWAIYVTFFAGISWAMGGRHFLRPALVTATVAAAGVLLLVLALGWAMTPWRARRIFRQQKSLAGDYTVRWDAEGFAVEGLRGRSAMPWPVLHVWMDGAAALLLFQSDQMFHALPKRALAPGDAAAIIAHLRAAGVPERRRFGLFGAPAGAAR